ncbi:MAG: hypothetical protein AB1428_13605 [Bacteroidota bacterium]
MRRFLTAAYVLFVAGIALVVLSRPLYNWDILPYMGLALAFENPEPITLHARTYAAARAEIPPAKFAALTDSMHAFRGKAARDPFFFREQLRLYAVKPLYVQAVRLCAAVGIPLTRATVMPSALSYVVLCLLLLVWIARIMPGLSGIVVSGTLAVLPFLLEAAGSSTPDLLCGLLLLSGTYMLMERERVSMGLALLTGGVLSRLDAVLFAVAIVGYVAAYRKARRTTCVIWGAAMIAGIAGFMGLERIDPGRFITFLSSAELTAGTAGAGLLSGYWVTLTNGLRSLTLSALAPVVFVAVCTLYIRVSGKPARRLDPSSVLLLVILAHVFVRFLLHPVVEDRFLIANYLVVAILFLKTLVEVLPGRRTGEPPQPA